MKKFTLLATAALAMVAGTANAELMDKAFYRMAKFETIQDATVTATGEGTCPITVTSNKSNNTPRYLFTKWGEAAYAKCPNPLPETGYDYSTYFTISADGGVSNCLEFVLAPVNASFKLTHMRLWNSTEYFFRFHQSANSVDGVQPIYINGDVENDADWNFGEEVGTKVEFHTGVKYEIRVNIDQAETKATYKITDVAADTIVSTGEKDITAFEDKKIGMIWFNTGGASTYNFDDMKLSTLQNGPFANDPRLELFWVEGEERDYFAQFGEGEVLHWVQLGDAEDVVSGNSYENGVEYTVSYDEAMDSKDFEQGEDKGRKIITCMASGALKVWTSMESDETNTSDEVTVDVACETISLPNPVATITNVTEGYGKTYAITCDNSEVLLNPVITIHYKMSNGNEGDIMAGDNIEFTAAGSVELYAWDKTHKNECYGHSETVTITNDVEYEVAVDKSFVMDYNAINAGLEGFHVVEIVDAAGKSHWDRIMSTETRGYKADGTNEVWNADNASEYEWVKEGHGIFADTDCGTENAKWNNLVADDPRKIALPLIPSEEDPETYKVLNEKTDYAWAIFPYEGVVYYDVNTTADNGVCAVKKNDAGAAGYVEMMLEEKYTSDNDAKPNFYIVNKVFGYNRPDKGDCSSSEVLVCGQKFWLYRYDTAIRSVKVMTYKGFVIDDAIESVAAGQSESVRFNLNGTRANAAAGLQVVDGKVLFVK